MIADNREWHPQQGASAEEIAAARGSSPKQLPDSYFALLAHCNGGEGPLPVSPYYFILDPANEASSGSLVRAHGLDGLFVIGGNGGGELIAFDLREENPWPIVHVDMIAGADSIETIATDFDEFVAMIGLNAEG
jgi:hypothetical protein